jgi:hypothetical protein
MPSRSSSSASSPAISLGSLPASVAASLSLPASSVSSMSSASSGSVFGPAAKGVPPVILAPVVSAAASPKSSWSSSSGSKKRKPAIKFKIKSPGAKGGPAPLPVFFPAPPGFKSKRAVAAAAPVAPVAVVAPAQSAPMIVFDSPKEVVLGPAAYRGVPPVILAPAVSAASSPASSVNSMDYLLAPAVSAASSPASSVNSMDYLLPPAVLPPSSPKASAKGASAGLGAVAASAPMVVVPSPRASAKAAEKAAALERLIAKTREILAVRRLRAIGATAAAQSAKAHKSPSAAAKLEVAKAAVAKFKAAKSTLEKASARAGAGAFAVASAPMVVVASPKGAKAVSAPMVVVASPKGAKVASASSWGASPKGKGSDSWSRNVVMKDDMPVGSLGWGESPKAKSASLMSSLRASSKAVSPKAVSPKAVSPKAASPKAKVSAKLRAHRAAAMGGPKSRKISDPLLDLEKRIEAGARKEKRLERYHRLLREGRRKEAMRYMRKHNMLDEVMDMSHVVRLEDLERVGSPPKKGSPLGSRGKVGIHAKDIGLEVVDLDKYGSPLGSRRKSVQPAEDLELEVVELDPYGSSPGSRGKSGQPAEDFELEVVDLDPYGSPPGSRGKSGQPAEDSGLEVVDFEPYGSSSKKRSSSGSRKRSSGKSSDSRSRKQGLSFGKMAKALEIQAKQDAVFRPASFKEPPKPVARARGAAAGRKEDPAVAKLHEKVVNLATSPTFNRHDPSKGAWTG